MKPKNAAILGTCIGALAAATLTARRSTRQATATHPPEPEPAGPPPTAPDEPAIPHRPEPAREPRHDAAAVSGKAAVIKQLEESFREMYLTLVSIIQGVTFGFLADRLFAEPRPTTEQWLAYTICFLMMVVVWMEYMVGSTAFTWIPTLLDSIVPFGLGMAEVPLIIAARMDAGAFLIRLAVFLAVGLLAYTNWLYHAAHGGELNRHSYPVLGHYVRFGAVACSATLAVTLVFAALRDAGIGFGDVSFLVATLVLVQPLFLHSIRDWTVALHRIRNHEPAPAREPVPVPTQQHAKVRLSPVRRLVIALLTYALRSAEPGGDLGDR